MQFEQPQENQEQELINSELQHQQERIQELSSIVQLIQTPNDLELANALLKKRIEELKKSGMLLPQVRQIKERRIAVQQPRDALKIIHQLQEDYRLDPDERLAKMKAQMLGWVQDIGFDKLNPEVFQGFFQVAQQITDDEAFIYFFNKHYHQLLKLQWAIQDGFVVSQDSYYDWIEANRPVKASLIRWLHIKTLKLPSLTRRFGHLDPAIRRKASVL